VFVFEPYDDLGFISVDPPLKELYGKAGISAKISTIAELTKNRLAASEDKDIRIWNMVSRQSVVLSLVTQARFAVSFS
jgi:hypothetical protein